MFLRVESCALGECTFNTNDFMSYTSAAQLFIMFSKCPGCDLQGQFSSRHFGNASPIPDQDQRPTIQILQSDIVYETEKDLRVSSLEGLRYLNKQYQISSSKHPGRSIRLANMVSFNLRECLIGSYNYLPQ